MSRKRINKQIPYPDDDKYYQPSHTKKWYLENKEKYETEENFKQYCIIKNKRNA